MSSLTELKSRLRRLTSDAAAVKRTGEVLAAAMKPTPTRDATLQLLGQLYNRTAKARDELRIEFLEAQDAAREARLEAYPRKHAR